MAETKFWRCKHCGNVFATIVDGGVNPMCCGEKMELLSANSTDAATEKHVPVVESIAGGHAWKVTVGEVEHPMTEEHHIEWIAMVGDGRVDIVRLAPTDKPMAMFAGEVHKSGTVYAYCNLHGLWKAEF
ncbi:MAG: desulfoferrodoxin Dfx [Atopobiaceae bacterium]|jgi:superoxide reductase|nr:desulfoferrodoxin Dfx [Atopobiaceae bacterium]MCI2172747.1 desulfoferrodoxin Dfx [Atopobiaceae bacterium]MCI2207054.1 desulfoferrodoxin Dfx [Atopobiaceae bacterium]